MKTVITPVVSAFLMGVTLSVNALPQDQATNIQHARQLIKQFGGNLKHELKAAIKQQGLAKAVEVCHLKAPDIATDVSDASGWVVRRTSLKVRNLEDAPDKWEYAVLKKFEQRKAAGESLKTMDYSEQVKADGVEYFRYMKAIPTQKVCLKCHGDSIASGVAKQLDSLYPFDQATGFKLGDIRGAFSLSKKVAIDK